MIHRKAKSGTLAVLLTFSLILSACSSGGGENAVAADAGRTVQTEQVKAEQLSSSTSLAGTLEAYDETVVSFQADGRVASISVNEGDTVQTGDVLAQLDTSDYELQASRADAALQQADAALQSAAAGVSSAKAQAQSAEASLKQLKSGARTQEREQAENAVELAQSAYDKSKTDAERITSLYGEGLVSLDDKEQADLALANAKTQLDNAKSQLSLIQEGATNEQLEAANASVAQANAGVESALASKAQAEAARQDALAASEQAALMLSRTKLTAPVAGTVLEKMIVQGELTGSGQPAVRIGQLERLKALLPVPDGEIADWSTGQTVNVQLYGETRTAKVAKIYPVANADAGSVNVEIAIDNPELDWTPGQVIKAYRGSTGKTGITVPIEAVISSGSEPYVFKVENGTAVKTEVETGELYDNRLLIVSGLSEGDVIVTSGASQLLNGDAVTAAEDTAND